MLWSRRANIWSRKTNSRRRTCRHLRRRPDTRFLLEQLLPPVDLDVERRGDEVGEQLRVVRERLVRLVAGLIREVAERRRVLAEGLRRAPGKVGDGGLVTAGVLEVADGADQVGAIEGQALDPEPRCAGDNEVESAVVESLELVDLGERADRERKRGAAHLDALADADDPEARALLLTVADHLAITLFENVQARGHVREEHCVERKQRQANRHGGQCTAELTDARTGGAPAYAALQFLLCLRMRSRLGSPGLR